VGINDSDFFVISHDYLLDCLWSQSSKSQVASLAEIFGDRISSYGMSW